MGMDIGFKIIPRKGTGYWTLSKKREYNRNLIEALVAHGADIRKAEDYGLVEQWITVNNYLSRNDAKYLVEIQSPPEHILNAPENSRPEVPIDVYVKSRKKGRGPYPIRVLLERDDSLSTEEKVIFNVQKTVDIEHICEDTKYNIFKSCFHKIFASIAVDSALSSALEDARIDYVEIRSFYKYHKIFPVSPDITEFYETIKNEKSITRKTMLQKYFISDVKLFKL